MDAQTLISIVGIIGSIVGTLGGVYLGHFLNAKSRKKDEERIKNFEYKEMLQAFIIEFIENREINSNLIVYSNPLEYTILQRPSKKPTSFNTRMWEIYKIKIGRMPKSLQKNLLEFYTNLQNRELNIYNRELKEDIDKLHEELLSEIVKIGKQK